MPSMRMVFTFEETPTGSRVTTVTTFGSVAEIEQLLGMGMEEGMRSAMAQIDQALADLSAFAAGRATESQLLDDTRVRVSRVIRGTVEQESSLERPSRGFVDRLLDTVIPASA